MQHISFSEFSSSLSGAIDLQDIFYIVEGNATTVEGWIRMKRENLKRMSDLSARGEVLKLSDPARRADFNKRLLEMGITVQSVAQVSGLPPIQEYQAEGVKISRADGKGILSTLESLQFIQRAAVIPTPELRPLIVAMVVDAGGPPESFTVTLADERRHFNYDFNPPVFLIKASGMVMSVLRDLFYSTVDKVEVKGFDVFHEEAKAFASSHYYGNMNYQYQLNRLNAVMQVGREVRNAANGGGNNFQDLAKLLEDPLVLLKKATDYVARLEKVTPAAPIHKSIRDKFNSIYRGSKGVSAIYIISEVVRQFHLFFNGAKENVTAEGSEFSIAVTATLQDHITKHPNSELSMAYKRALMLRSDRVDRYIVAGRAFGVSLNNQASAGPLYKDAKHNTVGLDEIVEASSLMLYLGRQYDHPLCNNIPSPGTAQAMTQLINERRVYELKPKAEVYALEKPMIRNIMAGTYAKEIPMGIFNQLTRKFNRHALTDPTTRSMLRMPLTHGGADMWLKHASHSLRDSTEKFSLFTMADNYYIFYKAGGSVRMASTDVAKAESCVGQLTEFASNLRTLGQMGLSSAIKTVTKQTVDQVMNSTAGLKGEGLHAALEDTALDVKYVLNVRKKERRLEKQGKIKKIKEGRKETKDLGIYESTMNDPLGWIYYLLYFYPYTGADVNVVLRQEHLFCLGMPSGIINTAYYNNDKSAYAYDAVAAVVRGWIREFDDFDHGFHNKGRKHTDVLEKGFQSFSFMRDAELKMTVEADLQIMSARDYDLDSSTNEEIGVADLLGFDLRIVDPEDGFPLMYIPVLRKRSLFGILMFQKFERKLAGLPETPDLVLTKNLLLVINLKVAYFVGGWAYRYISLWIRSTLRRVYLNYPDLRETLTRVSEDQIISTACDALGYEESQFQDLLGLALVDVIRKPNVSLDLVWRVYGHGKGAFSDDRDRIIAPNLVRRLFKDYVPVTETDFMMNMVAVMARAAKSPAGQQGEEPAETAAFINGIKIYLNLLDGKPPFAECKLELIAGGQSFEQRMATVTEGFELMDVAEGAVVPDDIDEAFYQSMEVPRRGPKVGATFPAARLATSTEQDPMQMLQPGSYVRGKVDVPVVETTKIKFTTKKGVTPTLVPEVDQERLPYVIKWARTIARLLKEPAAVGQPKGPLRIAFENSMPLFVSPKSGAPYDKDRHLTKISIMRLLKEVNRQNDAAVRKGGQPLYPYLDITRDEFSAVEKALEASAGRTKKYSNLPPALLDAKFPVDNKNNFNVFVRTVAPLLNELMASSLDKYLNLGPAEVKAEDVRLLTKVEPAVAKEEPVVVHTNPAPAPEQPPALNATPRRLWGADSDDDIA